MSVLPFLRQPVQRRRHDLDAYLNHMTDLTLRHAADAWATWQRIVETARRTGYSANEAEQMADRFLLYGEMPV